MAGDAPPPGVAAALAATEAWIAKPTDGNRRAALQRAGQDGGASPLWVMPANLIGKSAGRYDPRGRSEGRVSFTHPPARRHTMAYELVKSGSTEFAGDWSVVVRFLRAYWFARYRAEQTTVKAVSEATWNPLSWSFPVISTSRCNGTT